MAGETCPRCRGRNGYPLPQSIPRGRGMTFVCRDCGHQWVKRNMSGGKIREWRVYGIGFLIGIFVGIYMLLNGLFGDKVQGFTAKAKELFESLVNVIKGIL